MWRSLYYALMTLNNSTRYFVPNPLLPRFCIHKPIHLQHLDMHSLPHEYSQASGVPITVLRTFSYLQLVVSITHRPLLALLLPDVLKCVLVERFHTLFVGSRLAIVLRGHEVKHVLNDGRRDLREALFEKVEIPV